MQNHKTALLFVRILSWSMQITFILYLCREICRKRGRGLEPADIARETNL
ncbi:hypothetical protein DESHY_80126 [Desulforamulus hydrothermalis Lam5 = DSM 18033]|uniref:Transposase n=1 Tax=Desulforamulus hydrothermalis Lam5 = DSM 18033 TaxID=1121428 RepID=K8E174_9FIRM|nr:hypothetical protein DESHY_80126 [Desulforamulus hydrothermalis Lam5 = DSM 18033]